MHGMARCNFLMVRFAELVAAIRPNSSALFQRLGPGDPLRPFTWRSMWPSKVNHGYVLRKMLWQLMPFHRPSPAGISSESAF